ncbi:helix-turn-helix domain-containing protein [Streptomyces sp. NPDC048577]|uniref:helix-turn-helix domain-containing protein n=1 Tax=Streptomyces sp. NPDC048577 TaxID=3157209 RepID=UPI0034298C3D
MRLRYSFGLTPTPGRRTAPARAFGCARVVYNDAIAAREAARAEGRKAPSMAELSATLITQAKRTPERAWPAEVSPVVRAAAGGPRVRCAAGPGHQRSDQRKARRWPSGTCPRSARKTTAPGCGGV